VLILFGAPATIYVFSNVGYVGSFVPVLVGYYFLRRWHPAMARPYRLPEFMKYVALALAALYFIIWLFGGFIYTGLPLAALGGANTRIYYFLGWLTLLSYLPLYWYRTAIEDKRQGATAGEAGAAATATS